MGQQQRKDHGIGHEKEELLPHPVRRTEARHQSLQGHQQHDHQHHGALGNNGSQGIALQHCKDAVVPEYLFQFKADARHGQFTSCCVFCTASRYRLR